MLIFQPSVSGEPPPNMSPSALCPQPFAISEPGTVQPHPLQQQHENLVQHQQHTPTHVLQHLQHTKNHTPQTSPQVSRQLESSAMQNGIMVVVQPAGPPKFCDECGTPYIRETSKFCSECGTKRLGL